MSILNKLWDETVAGPIPDSGLGKLRKYDSFSAVSRPPSDNSPPASSSVDDNLPISRTITILRTNSTPTPPRSVTVASPDPLSVPSSPAGSDAPSSPFSRGSPRGNFKKFSKQKMKPESLQSAESESPTGYDWILLSALDR